MTLNWMSGWMLDTFKLRAKLLIQGKTLLKGNFHSKSCASLKPQDPMCTLEL